MSDYFPINEADVNNMNVGFSSCCLDVNNGAKICSINYFSNDCGINLVLEFNDIDNQQEPCIFSIDYSCKISLVKKMISGLAVLLKSKGFNKLLCWEPEENSEEEELYKSLGFDVNVNFPDYLVRE
ncbi:MAG: hypothetical protein WC307_03585 [Candidatus Nanoarchaeia archaeon]|jgi:hypothetical protein